MSYQLEGAETLSGGVKRIAKEELDSAVKGLRDHAAGRDEAIHDARKRFKKLRAVLRLVRKDLGGKEYREANVLLRDAGRDLSGLRDAEVLVATLDTLAEHFDSAVYQKTFKAVRMTLVARQQLAAARADELTREVAERVATLQEQITRWPVGDDWGSVGPNLRYGYEGGLKAFKNAYRYPSDDSFHEWRKRVKDLWYHLRILNPLWPGVMDGLAAQAGKLADLLGEEHDVAVLSKTLADDLTAFGDAAEVKTLLEPIERYRQSLRVEARLLGQRLYAETPKQFARRFQTYWRTWRAEVEASEQRSARV